MTFLSPAGLILLFALFFSSTNVYSQNTQGTVSGTIRNSEQQPIENATVSLRGTSVKTTTNASGSFQLKASAGSYELQVSIVGYRRQNVKVQIQAGRETPMEPLILVSDNEMHEVKIAGKTQVKKIKEQAFNVNIIDARQLYNTSADLNQALNKTSGVRIRENGGTGSDFTFSLNGFSGKQVKFFLDGIPMDNFGSSLTLNNYPSNMAERVEIYKGVLPITLGADALGGAVNVVTRTNPNFLDVSYGYGSFNTHKASVNAAYTNAKTGFTIRTNAFYNYSDNDYTVNVQPIVNNSKLPFQDIKRFHDGYESGTVQMEAGVTGKKYADKLLFGIITSGNDKEVQTGVTMDQVFGALQTRSTSTIPTLKYKKANLFTNGLDVSLYSAYNLSRNRVIDTSLVRYNWLQETTGGFSSERNRTQIKNKDNEALVTANIAYRIDHRNAISYNYALNDFRRKSSDIEDPDNITFLYPQSVTKQVMGLAWQTTADLFTATAFTKLYYQKARSFENISKNNTANYAATSQNTSNLGYGAAAAYFIVPELQAKVSYEHAYRLPESIEILGDALFYAPNPDLKPEKSNNLNIGGIYNFPVSGNNKLSVEANFIYRNAKDYIRLNQLESQPTNRQFINVGAVRTTGGEAEVKYSWKDKIYAAVNVTYQRIIDKTEFLTVENLVDTITVANLNYNYRLPNMPYLFGNFDLGTVFHRVAGEKNSLNINYSLNYVEKYYLTPSQLGNDNQDIIPRQLAHNLMANYVIGNGKYNISLECRNFMDNKLFDNYKLQKPGRSVFLKLRYFISK